jgi:hypothetical protein
MSLLGELTMYGRFLARLPGFLRHPISLDEARAVLRRRLDERESSFLRLLERGVFGHPRSPYLPLLRGAGCTLSDVREMVRTRGLEESLRALREAGVFVTFEEFKGREPIRRHGVVRAVEAHDFDNPHLRRAYQTETGGSTGSATRIDTDLDHLAAQVAYQVVGYHAHGVLHAPTAIWRGVLPDGSGLNNLLRSAGCGHTVHRWFSHVSSRDLRQSLKYRLATHAAVLAGRMAGCPLPWPEPVPTDQAIVVARWAAETLRRHGVCLVLTAVSRAVRVCLAAEDAGLDLSGAVFLVGGEPPTPAKVRVINRVGARHFPTYSLTEAGRIGFGCSQPADANDLHFLRDAFGLIQHPTRVPGSTMTVPAFSLTTLLPTAPKILVNVETDDYGVVEERACGCPLHACGFTQHLREIHSFRKLTGEGVTLVGSEMLHILEEVLPSRFGGSPLDYQLIEEEAEDGLTRVSLVISPRVSLPDDATVIRTVLEALGQGSVAADQVRVIWGQSGTLRIKRMEPILTGRGKLLPLQLARRTAPAAGAGPPGAATGAACSAAPGSSPPRSPA